MIITKEVKIKINSSNINRLRNFGYKNLKIKSDIEIPIEHLSMSSTHIIKTKCDVCNKIKNIQYRYYNNSFKNGDYFCCSKKCATIKRKNTVKKLYGVEFISQSDIIKKKIKDVNIENYGVEHNSQRQDIKIKKKKTTLENYGVENPSQSEIIKKKKENTSLNNYGVKYHTQNIKKYNSTFKIYLKKYKNYNLNYQSSYELDFLDFCYNNNIINDLSNFKKGVKYIYDSKNKIYYPDFFIKKLNLIIEIKSKYWYDKFLDKNKEKMNSCKKQKFNFIFIIDKDYSNFIDVFYPSKPL